MANLKIGKMVLRSLFKRPATLMYPTVPREWKELTRGRIEIDIDSCIFCGICARKCPTDAIAVDRNAKSWSIARMGCVQCSCCVEACPKSCLLNKAGYTSPDTEKVVDTFVKPEAEPGSVVDS
ncbi:MAG: 4Fe-4S binding protein [Clostridiales Family XIII bacterium]|jgi:formate hydrogenlyase subunit 6/NADH:ubiquinone oxidoreductase subunit I|nr:4Fe-4S binding protein [Clostridiales Family XIII bacterium]